jgi:hypothetical protein
MFRTIVLLGIGLLIGYFVGFEDARKHDKHAVLRAVERVGGKTRDAVGSERTRMIEEIDGQVRRR